MTTDARSFPDHVDVEWLRAHRDDEGLVIVDSTTHLTVPDDGPYTPESGAETYRAEHIPGAVFADLLTDFADTSSPDAWTVPSSSQFAAAAGALGIGDGARVIVYDQLQGFWGTRFWWHLRLEGFDDVAVLDGGLAAWKTAGQPVTDAASSVTPRTFTSVRRPELLRSTQEVVAALDDPTTVLINVLDPATYRGETATYARNGHIPGSVNLPVFDVLDPETNAFRSTVQLRELFTEAGLLDDSRTVVTYCGGGIAATGLAHALARVGRNDVAVYDGSLTAWASDPELPLVTGAAPR